MRRIWFAFGYARRCFRTAYKGYHEGYPIPIVMDAYFHAIVPDAARVNFICQVNAALKDLKDKGRQDGWIEE